MRLGESLGTRLGGEPGNEARGEPGNEAINAPWTPLSVNHIMKWVKLGLNITDLKRV